MSLDIELAQKREIAAGIYNDLQAQRRKTSLEGFYNGEVIYPNQKRRIYVNNLSVNAAYEQEMWRQRGFTTEDIASGITAVREHEFLNPKWPKVPYQPEPQLRYIALAGTGRVLEGRGLEEPFEPAELDPIHLDAIQRVHTLSSAPVIILEIFQTYENFRQVLDDPDLTGIDTVEWGSPIQIVYNGGLRQFIHALELNGRGQLDKLDTAAHALRASLDRRDHFTKLLETLEKARS